MRISGFNLQLTNQTAKAKLKKGGLRELFKGKNIKVTK